MIDKRALNNEIVAMRKVFKQAKVQIIHKLSREIKGLRSKEGPEDLKEKCSRKADRKRDEIFAIKKLKPDDVSKFALKNLEDPIKKIGDAGVSLELRAYFRFAASKVLSARVNAFREQYPDWKDYIHELLDGLGARRKNLNPPAKLAKGPGPNPTAVNKNNSNLTQNPSPINKTPGIEKEESSGNTLESKSPQVKGCKKLNGKISASKESATPVKKSKLLSQWSVQEIEPAANHVSLVDAHKNEDLRSENIAKEDARVNNKHKPVNQFGGVKKGSGIAEVKRFHELCEAQESASDIIKEEPVTSDEGDSGDDNDDESADGQAVDPFFVKSDGKTGYVTRMVVEEEGEEGERGGGSPTPPFGRKQLRGGRGLNERGGGRGGGGQGFRGGRGSFSDRGQSNRGRGGSHGGDKSWKERSRRGNDRGRRGHDQGSRFAGRSESGHGGNSKFVPKSLDTHGESGANLHPSWEAKKKLQEQSISRIAFQGKKIKFDDDD